MYIKKNYCHCIIVGWLKNRFDKLADNNRFDIVRLYPYIVMHTIIMLKLCFFFSLSTSFELSDLFGGKLGKPIFYRLFDDFMYGHKHNRELIRVIMNLYQGFIYECWIIKYNSIVELYPLWKIAFIVELNCVVSDINELSSSENWIRLLRRMRACFLLVFTVRMIVVGWLVARPHNKKSLSSVPRPSAARVIRP